MALLDYFTSLSRGSANLDDAVKSMPATAEGESAELSGLNFITAMEAHAKWKMRLKEYIEGRSDTELTVESISRDDQCVLGKWLYNEGKGQFGHLPEFQNLVNLHQEFHTCAGRVLATAQEGDPEKALQLLETGEYLQASLSISSRLAQLYCRLRASNLGQG